MSVIVKCTDLTKRYKKNTVVKQASFEMKRGHIYGLVGPNGAGKTTIMKMLAGLTSVDSGEVELFGSSKQLDQSRERMSFIIEAPYIDKSMTARNNLMYIRFLRGVADVGKVDEVLELVGLADAGKKTAGKFSLGMRQRLGIGMALLASPEILVLDEPVNGLDPEGIVDVRNLLRKLSVEENVTILISSHLLAELSELCTDYIFIHHGEILETITEKELKKKCRLYLSIKTTNLSGSIAALEKRYGIKDYRVTGDGELQLYEMTDRLEEVSRTITEQGDAILQLVRMGAGLEDYYLEKVGDQNA